MSTRSIRKVGASAALGVAGLVAGGVLATSMTANAATTAPSYGAPGTTGSAPGRGASQDAAVTGTEADKVKAAVKAKYAGATITTVRKDPDGSYDALGTDASGNQVFYDVSKDLATITAGGGGGHRGPGAGQPPASGSTQSG